MTIFRCSALFILLVGCQDAPLPEAAPDMSICVHAADLVAPDTPASNALEQVDVADKCVRKFAYKLGLSQGSNREIANAAVAACRTEIYLIHSVETGKRPKEELVTAETTALLEEAVNYVIEGRAGNCAPLARGAE